MFSSQRGTAILMTRSSSDVKSDKVVLHCTNVRIHFGFAIAFGLPLKQAYHLLHISDFHPLVSIKFVHNSFNYRYFHSKLSQPCGNGWKPQALPISLSHFSVSVPVQLLLKSNPHNQLVYDTEHHPFRDPFHTIALRFSKL